MDKQFLEFWGNLLLNAAKGQEHLDEVTRCIREGFKGFDQQLSLLRKCYGLKGEAESSPDNAEIWSKEASDFQNSYREFLGIMGLVPKEEYLALEEKYEALKEKLNSQEETIRHLKMKSSTSEVDAAEFIKGFDQLIKEQSTQFQELMKSFGQVYKKPAKK